MFETKLRRAKNQTFYLRVQGSDLVPNEPEIALNLLGRYFALGGDLSAGLAQAKRAQAYLALARIDEAFGAYEAALAQERVVPNIGTNARVDYPYEIVLRRRIDCFDRALAVMEEFPERSPFAIAHFKRHAAKALILEETSPGTARRHAALALEVAHRNHSGFERHPTLGLVTSKHEATLAELQRLIGT